MNTINEKEVYYFGGVYHLVVLKELFKSFDGSSDLMFHCLVNDKINDLEYSDSYGLIHARESWKYIKTITDDEYKIALDSIKNIVDYKTLEIEEKSK